MALEGEVTTPNDGDTPKSKGPRSSRLSTLIQESRRSIVSGIPVSHEAMEDLEAIDELEEERERVHESLRRRFSVFEHQDTSRLVEVRLHNLSYCVPIRMGAPAVKTVMNQSICYGAYEFFHRLGQYCTNKNRGEGETSSRRSSLWLPRKASDILNPFNAKPVLNEIDLVLKPGTTYLLLGPPGTPGILSVDSMLHLCLPSCARTLTNSCSFASFSGCGKTTLLKAIAGRLPNHAPKKKGADLPKNKAYQTGRVEYNGVSLEDDPDMILPNICSFVGQLDNHAAYLTVRETFEFAFQCRTGGVLEHTGIHASNLANDIPRERFSENLTIDGMDLTQCADTFVGDDNVRGVSGGQRRRVTVGEMMQGANPVACADEFSTGLDAAVTYDIAYSIVRFAKAAKTTRIVSLLQPGPETFSLFDEVILLSEGYVIYAGPIDDVVEYFEGLGYMQPERMDVADFLQSIPTQDGILLFDPSKSPADEHYTSEEFANAFKQSAQYQKISNELTSPNPKAWNVKGVDEEEGGAGSSGNGVPVEYKTPWQNSFWRATMLNFQRNFTLWKRDKGFIIGMLRHAS